MVLMKNWIIASCFETNSICVAIVKRNNYVRMRRAMTTNDLKLLLYTQILINKITIKSTPNPAEGL